MERSTLKINLVLIFLQLQCISGNIPIFQSRSFSDPMKGFKNNYLIVHIDNHGKIDSEARYRYQVWQSNSKIGSILFGDRYYTSVLYYPSLEKSSHYLEDHFGEPGVISELCDNYFPISSFRKNQGFSIFDRRNISEEKRYHDFSKNIYQELSEDESIYVELNLESSTATEKLIKTPKDVFNQKCI